MMSHVLSITGIYLEIWITFAMGAISTAMWTICIGGSFAVEPKTGI